MNERRRLGLLDRYRIGRRLQLQDRGERERLEVARFLRNRGSQFLFWGNRATRIGGSIHEESWSQFLFMGSRATSSLPSLFESTCYIQTLGEFGNLNLCPDYFSLPILI